MHLLSVHARSHDSGPVVPADAPCGIGQDGSCEGGVAICLVVNGLAVQATSGLLGSHTDRWVTRAGQEIADGLGVDEESVRVYPCGNHSAAFSFQVECATTDDCNGYLTALTEMQSDPAAGDGYNNHIQ